MAEVPTITGASVAPKAVALPLQRGRGVNLKAVGQGLLNAGRSFELANLEISQITLAEADAAFVSQLNNRLYNDDDAYFKRVGKDAVDGHVAAMEELNKIRDEVAKSFLTGGRDNRIFALSAQKRIELATVKMSAHAFDARKAWDLDTSTANITANLEAAASDPSPENLALTRVRIEEEAANIAKLQGLPPEKAAELVSEYLSGMYVAAIETAMINDLNAANELLERFKGDINADDENKIRTRLAKHNVTQRGAALADKVYAEGGTIGEMTKRIRALADNDIPVRDDAIRRITNRRNQSEVDRVVMNRDVYNDLGNALLNGDLTTDDMRKMHADKWEGVLTQSQRLQLLKLEADAAAGKVYVTDWGLWAKLTLMSPLDLAKELPMDLRDKLATAEFKPIVEDIAKALRGELGFSTTQIRTANAQLKVELGSTKIDSDKGRRAYKEMRERLDAFEKAKESKATEDEIAGILSKLMVDITLTSRPTFVDKALSLLGGGSGVTAREFKAFEVTLKDIPKDTQLAIVKSYMENNNKELPSENDIIDIWVGLQLLQQKKN